MSLLIVECQSQGERKKGEGLVLRKIQAYSAKGMKKNQANKEIDKLPVRNKSQLRYAYQEGRKTIKGDRM